ncbi:MAG TPA: hypothetical protein VFD60_06905 [Nitrososphaeraceae archaeon]|nr:hypothetical protein [Nitrososphaeraceae archaeon]
MERRSSFEARITTIRSLFLYRLTIHQSNCRKRGIDIIPALTIFFLLLLSGPIIIQNLVSMAYADKSGGNPLINGVTDQLLNVDTTQAATQQQQQQQLQPQQAPQQGQQLPQQQIQQQTLSQSNSNTTATPTPSTTNTGSENSMPVSSIKITSVNPPSVSSISQLPTSISPPTSLQSDRNSIFQAFNSSNIGNNHPIPELVSNAGSLVTLDGTSSHSPDGKPIAFIWTQIAGPSVVLNGADSSKATFIAPNIPISTAMFFKLIVMDTTGLSDSAIVKVTVIP